MNIHVSSEKIIDVILKKWYLFNMDTKEPRITFLATKELEKRLEDFRFENRIKSMSEAIRRLINEGLKKYEKKAKE